MGVGNFRGDKTNSLIDTWKSAASEAYRRPHAVSTHSYVRSSSSRLRRGRVRFFSTMETRRSAAGRGSPGLRLGAMGQPVLCVSVWEGRREAREGAVRMGE